MKIKWIGSAFVCMAFTFACGGGDGGSGVDSGTLLAELEPDESDAVCEGIFAADVDAREIDCGDGTTITVEEPTQEDIDDCADSLDSIGVEFPDCTATVGEFEACFDDLLAASDDELCDGGLPASCDAIFGDPDCGGA
jgi:hypothetical protein